MSRSPFDPIDIPEDAWLQESTTRILRAREAGALFKFAQKYGISQTRLATATGISQARINDLIKGRRGNITTLDAWERIANGLNMPDKARNLLGLAPKGTDEVVTTCAGHCYGRESTRTVQGPRAADADGLRRSLWRIPGIDLNGAFTPDDEQRISQAVQRPSRLDTTVIEQLSTILAGQRRLEDAIGPAVLLAPATAQLDVITAMLKDASGPHRDALARLVADWTTFTGWLHAALRNDDTALALFGRAEEFADDVGYGVGAALATSFRGYIARQQNRPRAVIRAASAALATPGKHQTQETYDLLQAAQGYAGLGDNEQGRLLDKAVDLARDATEPPAPVYWYSEPFFQLNIGLTLVGIGEFRDAAALLENGFEGIPSEQRGAEWLHEYKQALSCAKEQI